MCTEAGTAQGTGESAGKGVLGGKNSMAKAYGALVHAENCRRPEGEASVGALGTPYSACGGQFTGDPMVVSNMQSGKYPAGFGRPFGGMAWVDAGSLRTMVTSRKLNGLVSVYLLELGTQLVGVVCGDMSL